MKNNVSFRTATKKDIKLILSFIKQLAEYEGMAQQVTATEKDLKYWLFKKKSAKVVFEIVDNTEIGFALFFNNFSTFVGRAGLYLEDLYILPQYRGKGYGKNMFKYLATLAHKKGYGRMEWWCLNENKQGIDFYLSLKAQPMHEWTVFRLDKSKLNNLSQ